MTLSTLFSKAWKDYKRNFPAICALGILFFVFPSVLSILVNRSVSEPWMLFFSFRSFLIVSIISIISWIVPLWGTASLISVSLRYKRFTFGKAVSSLSSLYLPVIGYFVVTWIFLLGLFILLIVPGIIFSVFWIFSLYIFIARKGGIIRSLKESFHLVRGRWWKTLGYILLLIVFYLGLFVILGLIIGSPPDPSYYSRFSLAGELIVYALHGLLIAPLGILFLKHLYLAYKKRRSL